MKKLLLLTGLLWAATTLAQDKPGYEIKVTFKPFKNQYIYLGHYFGKSYPIIDSVMLNEKSEATFKGDKVLNGGIYLIGYPGRAGFFEILVDKQQHFSVIADTATIAKELRFINSPDNDLFTKYQQYMTEKGKEITIAQQQLKTAIDSKEKKIIKMQKEGGVLLSHVLLMDLN